MIRKEHKNKQVDLQTIADSLKNDRAISASRNVIWQAVCIVILSMGPFLLRTIMLHSMGMEILGLHSLLQTIINVLSISEMGFGQVMVYFLFVPLADGDVQKVNALLAAMRKIYRGIGIVFLVMGSLLIPFIPVLVCETTIPFSDILSYFGMYLISASLIYFSFMETVSLLNAMQRVDLYYKIAIIVNLLEYVAQALALILFHNYLLYLAIIGISAVIAGIIRRSMICKIYPQFKASGEISSKDWKQIKVRTLSVIGHQLDDKLLNSIDNIFLSFFLGLSTVALYGNYFYVITAVNMFMDIVFSSLLSAIGNALVTEDIKSNYFRFRCIFWLNAFLAGWATACMFNMYQNFMMIWVGDCFLGLDAVFFLCLYFYLSQMRKSVLLFKNAAGMWHNDRFKPYLSMGVDLILDMILIRLFGVKGAILSSIFCMLVIEMPWETYILFHHYFKRSVSEYFGTAFKYSIVNAVIILTTSYLCSILFPVTGFAWLVLTFLVCSIVTVVIEWLLFHDNVLFGTWIKTFKNIAHGFSGQFQIIKKN